MQLLSLMEKQTESAAIIKHLPYTCLHICKIFFMLCCFYVPGANVHPTSNVFAVCMLCVLSRQRIKVTQMRESA